MADLTLKHRSPVKAADEAINPKDWYQTLADQGDGTHAPKIALAGEITVADGAQITPSGWEYLGEERVTLADDAAALTLPDGTTVVWIKAEGGAVRYTINDDASATSAGYIPEDTGEVIGPLSNLESFSVYGATGAYANVNYYAG